MTGRTGALTGRRIVLGVTGSVAAYKAAVVARLLLKEGATVRVVLTAGGARFVGASTFSGLTGQPVLTEMFDAASGGELHVALAAETDLVLVVPATADFVARLATGRADDLLAATLLCARCPVLIAPAMHPSMWSHPSTQRNVRTLESDGRVECVGPVEGEVASGDTGTGRMADPDAIVARVIAKFASPDLAGKHVVITAGPTVEDIDPVRFVSNRSSGKMGFALAENAAARGARVTLVAGPVALPTPAGVDRVDVRSALEMQDALRGVLGEGLGAADALVMCAAVGDFRPEARLATKLKRGSSSFTLKLVQNPDILAEIGRSRRGARPVLVGFAVETGTDAAIVERARGKLRTKKVDIVVANHAADSLGREDNRVLLVDANDSVVLDVLPKRVVAERVMDWVAARLAGRGTALAPKRRPARAARTARRPRKTR